MTPSTKPSLDELKKRFFDDWIATEPEEATTLGIVDRDGRLRDPSVSAAEAAGARARSVLADLDAVEQTDGDRADTRFDRWALRAHATERALAADRGLATKTPEAVPYAIAMLAHAAAHATNAEERRVVARRLDALPAYVEVARTALESGVREGRPFSTAVLEMVSKQLDSAQADLREIVDTTFEHGDDTDTMKPRALDAASDAANAVVAFAAFLREHVAKSSGARDIVPMGEAEYGRRLSVWGLDSIEDVRRRATDELAIARDRMVEHAAAIAPSIPGAPEKVRSFTDARAVLDAVLVPRPSSPEAIVPLYEAEIARAVAFCRERKNFAIPDVCHCTVVRSPELWRNFAPCTNWPAPLLGGDAPGACAVVADPALHPLANVPGLAVHEAVPGHFLQSRAWQLRFGNDPAPVRFLSVPDECGVLRDAWIPHFMIEGWAVFSEARMEEAGFYDDTARLFHFFCRSIHAARALADLRLHTEGWSRPRIEAFLKESTGMPDRLAAYQAVRYARSGTQALGYLIGHLEIERVRSRTSERLGHSYDELAFQAELLDAGPVPPALLMHKE